jgi:hypothetical protein
VQIGAPCDDDVAGVVMQVARRVVRMLRRRGKVEDDAVADIEDDGSILLPCMVASVQRVGVVGEGAGRALLRPGRRRDVEVVRVAKRRCADVDGFRCMPMCAFRRATARSWNGCAGTWRGLRSRASGSSCSPTAASATASSGSGVTARRLSSSTHSTSRASWRRWFRDRVRT